MRSDRRRARFFVLMVLAPALVRAAPAILVERILAVVDGRPVLLSEVRAVQLLRALPSEPALEALIDERLMLREALRLSQAAVSEEEEQRARASLLERSPGARTLPEAELRRLVRRQTAILKYIEFRFRPQVSVSEAELHRAWEQEHGEKTPSPEETAALRERLFARALDEKIEAWVAELRAAAEIRYNLE